MNDKTTPVRPLVLELDDAREEIFGTVNRLATERHIPFYLLEGMMNDAARQVSALAKTEREKAKQMYDEQIAKMGNSTEDKADG